MPVVVDQVEIVPESVRSPSSTQPFSEAGPVGEFPAREVLAAIARGRERDLRRSPH